MRRVVVIMALVAFIAGASMAVTSPAHAIFGADGKTKGCLCCLKDTLMMAQTEADCAKVGGKVVKSPKDCGAEKGSKAK